MNKFKTNLSLCDLFYSFLNKKQAILQFYFYKIAKSLKIEGLKKKRLASKDGLRRDNPGKTPQKNGKNILQGRVSILQKCIFHLAIVRLFLDVRLADPKRIYAPDGAIEGLGFLG